MKKVDLKKFLMLNFPYFIIFYLVDKTVWLFRHCVGDTLIDRVTALQALPFEQAYLAELISKVALGVLSFLITAILTKNETLFSLFAQIKNNSGGKCDE